MDTWILIIDILIVVKISLQDDLKF